jgi:peptidoglycan L-alanyl-D-glutamate endopeptidase CwlK
MSSRDLTDLHPLVADKARQLIELATAEGIEILVTSTLRTFEEQAELFAKGRTEPGSIVTNARPGRSWHNFGLAFDVVPLINGKAIWNSPFWNKIGRLGEDVGLVWGGNFTSFKDRPHFEFHPHLTLAEANRRKEDNQNLLA